MKLAKTLAVLAAMFLVGAVAVGTLGPEDMTLGDALGALDRLRLAGFEQFVRLHLSNWVWDHPLKGLLMRPIWLAPASLGIILAGASASVASTGTPLNSRRRRS